MKKIFLLAVTVVALACSNDDGDTINPSQSTLKGTWIISKTIQPDGTLKDYYGECPAKQDSIIFTSYSSDVHTYIHSTCDTRFSIHELGCSGYWIDEGDTIRSCGDLFQGKVTLSNRKLRLDYAETETFGQPNLNNIKGVIFTRK
jgi:hypothetical protein